MKEKDLQAKPTKADLENLFYCYWQQDVKENGYTGSSKDWLKDNEDEVDSVKEFYHVS